MKRYIRQADADRILRRGQATVAALADALFDEVSTRRTGATTEAERAAILNEEIGKMIVAFDAVEAAVLTEIESASISPGDAEHGD